MSPWAARAAILALFTVSGFSGLIYESVWSGYLKLLLGHAAYARTVVLVIFMGAIGGFVLEGIIGLFVGAVVLAVGFTLFAEWLEDAPQS